LPDRSLGAVGKTKKRRNRVLDVLRDADKGFSYGRRAKKDA